MDVSSGRSCTPNYPESFENYTRQDNLNIPLLQDSGLERLDEQNFRVWIAPDLSNPEFLLLLSLFPSSISRREVPLFKPAGSKGKVPDIESGLAADEEKIEVQCGTGKMWIGCTERSLVTMKGGLWDRFLSWWRGLLCF